MTNEQTKARKALIDYLNGHELIEFDGRTVLVIGDASEVADEILALRPPLPAPSEDELEASVAEEIGWSFAHGLSPRETAARVLAHLASRPAPPEDVVAAASRLYADLATPGGWTHIPRTSADVRTVISAALAARPLPESEGRARG